MYASKVTYGSSCHLRGGRATLSAWEQNSRFLQRNLPRLDKPKSRRVDFGRMVPLTRLLIVDLVMFLLHSTPTMS